MAIRYDFNRKTPIDDTDLPEIRTLNSNWNGGKINSTNLDLVLPTYENYMDGDYTSFNNGAGLYLYRIISIIRNFMFSKFEYEGLPKGLTKQRIENMLLKYNSVALYELGDRYYCSPFTVNKYDIYNQPKEIKLTLNNELSDKLKMKPLKVGEDCVILENDNSGFIFGELKIGFSPLFKLWNLLKNTALAFYAIKINMTLSVERLVVGKDVGDNTKVALEQAFNSFDPVLNFDMNAIDFEKLGGKKTSNGLVSFTDRTDTVWKNYTNYIDEIKLSLGIKHNAGMEKKERMTNEEITSDNQMNEAILQTELEFRKIAFDEFNELFKQNVKVNISKTFMNEGEKEGENNGVVKQQLSKK